MNLADSFKPLREDNALAIVVPEHADDSALQIGKGCYCKRRDKIARVDYQLYARIVEEGDSAFNLRDVIVTIGHYAKFHEGSPFGLSCC